MLLSISTFIGHFHPVLVHLPVGILLVAVLIQALSFSKRYAALSVAIPFLLMVGMISAIASTITGLLLASDGEYDESAITAHMWMGVYVALLSIIMVFLSGNSRSAAFKVLSVMLLISITITGHLGGTLTHGEGYLTSGLSDEVAAKKVRAPIPDVGKAMAFKDVIRPILEEKCFSCHGAKKQKGKLRMDEFDDLMKGGKNGKVISPGKPAESEIIKRIELPPGDDHHMAPKEKAQISNNELALLKWWIETGASSAKKVSELPQDEKIKPRLLSLQSGTNEVSGGSSMAIPDEAIERGDPQVIRSLQENKAVVIPVARDKNYLEVNFFGDSSGFEKNLPSLMKLKSQVVSLKLPNIGLSQKSLQEIGKLKQLVQLNISNSGTTDEGLSSFTKLENLGTLNLVGNPVTARGLLQLKGLVKLKSLYLYQTKISPADWPQLKSSFKKVQLDSGGYVVPLFHTDTVEVKVVAT
ncbi:MAG: c-type cytochrome domain-containing protein [Chitinophagaceae bacterium]